MLSLLGFVMVGLVIVLIMTKRARVTPYVAMAVVPFVIALLGGFDFVSVSKMALAGITQITPIALLILFSVLYFGVMLDAGLFDPVIFRILKFAKGDPMKVIVATALLAMIVALAGDGAVTYMIVLTAMLPLYKQLSINRVILPTIVVLSVGVITNTPWSPPTARVIGVLHLEPAQFLHPLLPTMIAGAITVLLIAYIFGMQERKRLGAIQTDSVLEHDLATEYAEAQKNNELKRPKLLWANAVLTIALFSGLLIHGIPQSVLFMLALAIALLINYPKMEDQKSRIVAHAGSVLNIVSIIFSAGVFSGILRGAHMADAMAHTLVGLIPVSLGSHLSLITALISMPILFFMSIDSYMFGIVPVLAQTASAYGIPALDIGRASIMGHPVNILSPLVPNVFLLIGLAGVSLVELQRFAIKWTVLAALVMTAVAALTGCFTI